LHNARGQKRLDRLLAAAALRPMTALEILLVPGALTRTKRGS
jgi:hypothetical protein